MIICDKAYLRTLKREMKDARAQLPDEVADAIDAEIKAVEAQGDAWYGTVTIAKAFKVARVTLENRAGLAVRGGFQGDIPRLRLNGNRMDPYYGDWLDAASVNKNTVYYRTWAGTDDIFEALAISHRLMRYQHQNGGFAQVRIDRYRLKYGKELPNGNEEV